MRAILVSVDYSDLLAITLPFNRHHFEEVLVVTSKSDHKTQHIAHANQADTYCTDVFWDDGAAFNKWRALEDGLNYFGRRGWMTIMDADVLWPKKLPWNFKNYMLDRDCLYTPRRRMKYDVTTPVPPDDEWNKFELHPQQIEFAGYSQVFHAECQYLGQPPWHETNWRHCGGADSFFQAKWPETKKIRPEFEVLHLGEAGRNWCGRATRYTDGTMPEQSQEKIQQVKRFIMGRVRGPNRFDGEKIL